MELSKKEATQFFKRLDRHVAKLGFDEITPEEEAEVQDIIEYDELDLPRVLETKSQVSYKKEIKGYIIKIRSSYDRRIKNFTKTGRIWISVYGLRRKVGEKALYTTFLYRTGDQFIDRACDEITFLVHALNKRPFDSKKRRMELKERPTGNFNWVSVSKNCKERISFFHSIPDEVRGEILKKLHIKTHYQKVLRKRLNIKTRARDNRITRIPRKPGNLAPVL